MDLSALPQAGTRPPADPPLSPAAQLRQGASETRPETPRPVEATDPPPRPAPIPGLGIPPLDTFEVGDNDDVPLPPAPPPERSELARPVAAKVDTEDSPEDGTVSAERSAASDDPEGTAPQAEPPSRMTLPDLLDDLADGPANPTVNILR